MKVFNQYYRYIVYIIVLLPISVLAQENVVPDSLGAQSRTMNTVTVRARNGGKSSGSITNTEIIGQGELIRAACCNLGESFTTNPSVDVAYSDAATGARQIKLLGLSGTYVQMLTENMPNLRGASIPYSLAYVPGPWLQSIQVSKGASSVKNGYESITGQINIEYLKPQGIDGVRANAYLDNELKYDLNLDGSIHLTDRLSTSGLLHFEDRQTDHDRNGDGFMDMPRLRQWNGMWRMAYVSPRLISQLSFRGLHDERHSGMSRHAQQQQEMSPRYGIEVNTNRYELQWKNGVTLNNQHNTSVALMLNGTLHQGHNIMGNKQYDVNQKTAYAQLMFETDITPEHNISMGTSLNYDYYDEYYATGIVTEPLPSWWQERNHETTPGVYFQYTYHPNDRLTIMPGLRWDHSSWYGSFCTPRLHIRYQPWEFLTLRASAGKGYRTVHAMAENVSLMASGKDIVIAEPLGQEEAWNYGVATTWNIPIGEKKLEVNMDYYYTDFANQMVVHTPVNPFSGLRDRFVMENLHGSSYSHTFQIDATYSFFEGFTATGAFRYSDSKTTYNGILRRRPLTSLYKAMLTMGYKTPLELWHFDVTGSLNGPGELYDQTPYPAYFQLQAQVTREFRRFSIYAGGENLTNYTIPEPIRGASRPWSSDFDATQAWGPTSGAMGYIGIRFKLEKL